MEGILKYMIAIPCMDMMQTTFVAALLNMRRVGASKVSFLSSSLVYDARNMLTDEALNTGADRVLFVDSDMGFQKDMMERFAADMDEGRDFVCGIYFKRRLPTAPIIAKAVDGNLLTYIDYPRDQIFEVDAAGFGACRMSAKMLRDVKESFGAPFYPLNGEGEDYSFCAKARSLGYKLYCDSRIKVAHVGSFEYTEDVFLQQQP